jgi:hypothetical protein
MRGEYFGVVHSKEKEQQNWSNDHPHFLGCVAQDLFVYWRTISDDELDDVHWSVKREMTWACIRARVADVVRYSRILQMRLTWKNIVRHRAFTWSSKLNAELNSTPRFLIDVDGLMLLPSSVSVGRWVGWRDLGFGRWQTNAGVIFTVQPAEVLPFVLRLYTYQIISKYINTFRMMCTTTSAQLCVVISQFADVNP